MSRRQVHTPGAVGWRELKGHLHAIDGVISSANRDLLDRIPEDRESLGEIVRLTASVLSTLARYETELIQRLASEHAGTSISLSAQTVALLRPLGERVVWDRQSRRQSAERRLVDGLNGVISGLDRAAPGDSGWFPERGADLFEVLALVALAKRALAWYLDVHLCPRIWPQPPPPEGLEWLEGDGGLSWS